MKEMSSLTAYNASMVSRTLSTRAVSYVEMNLVGRHKIPYIVKFQYGFIKVLQNERNPVIGLYERVNVRL